MGLRLKGLFFFLAVTLFAQSKPQDVPGWDKIAWGMTLSEARAAYAVSAQPETQDTWTLLTLKPTKIAGVEMGVQLGAKKGTEKISLVRLWSFFGLATSAPGAGEQDFDTLRMFLIQKYGPPDHEETKHGENFRLLRSVTWMFPSTSIALSLEQSSSLPNLGNIYLDYSAAHPK